MTFASDLRVLPCPYCDQGWVEVGPHQRDQVCGVCGGSEEIPIELAGNPDEFLPTPTRRTEAGEQEDLPPVEQACENRSRLIRRAYINLYRADEANNSHLQHGYLHAAGLRLAEAGEHELARRCWELSPIGDVQPLIEAVEQLAAAPLALAAE